ncbi:hypothetical protein LCGC14_2640280 [marine sediment metagenome]|uniref:HNH nuclease domain-containing protein n=1 Tax=marine sediment metagenome TaxID=412755 RepID=A0A0F8ZXL4_9ZZZZ
MRKRQWDTFWLRFWERTNRGPDCWLWTGLKANGYGQMRTPEGKQEGAHRIAYRWANGDIPNGKMVLHRCGVKLCVKPEHLYIGGAKDNARDARRHGVLVTGKDHWQRQKTHCPQGHEYTDGNTHWYRGSRYCRACHKAYSLNYSRRNR